MSHPINDVILDNIADDVCELYEDKDDDDMIDALIELRFEALPEA